MDDREVWSRAVTAVAAEYRALPMALRSRVDATVDAIRSTKGELHRLAEAMQCATICASCGGECCVRGKYHVTVVDILVFLAAAEPLFVPRFGGEACPYLDGAGCMMAPSFRPFNCVTYNCERVEGGWDQERISEFYRRERQLRDLYGELERFFGNRFMHGLLMNYERDVMDRGEPILRYSERWIDGNDDQ
ncbi:hypothetical protein [Geobacter pickeringii]|uniref:hypothetical protein n=1 Tax=Geobacter pickeringii TaxID=345632 RepID=UPI000A4F38C3|nr:hypothetical protein [Geobacter pickeringii]